MLASLGSGEANHVIGDRFADMRAGAMTLRIRINNRLINVLFPTIYRNDSGDILSGTHASARGSFEGMHLTADGFGIETEMAVECAKRGIRTDGWRVDVGYPEDRDAAEQRLAEAANTTASE